MHSLCDLKFEFRLLLELELTLESKLRFKLPYRVANAELLVVVVEDTCCMW